jgi:hypothetical protein
MLQVSLLFDPEEIQVRLVIVNGVWHQTPPAGGHAYDWWIDTCSKR